MKEQMKERRRKQMFSPDPAWPPQVKEEEGWRQGCTRAALRRKQFGEAAVAKLRGAVNSWRRWHPVRGGSVSAGQRGTGRHRVLLLWYQTRAVGSEGWSRRYNPRPHGEKRKLTWGVGGG